MKETILQLLIEKLETRISEETQIEKQKISKLEETLARVAEMLPTLYPLGEPYYRAEMVIISNIERRSEQLVGSFTNQTDLRLLDDGRLYVVKKVSGLRNGIGWEFTDWLPISVPEAVRKFGYSEIIEALEDRLDECLAGVRDEEPGLVVAFKPEIPA
jgi:hypothetical protein